MLYAMNKWKRMILICLWPYAIRHANDIANAKPRNDKNLSPLEKFMGVQITPKLCHFHAFRCPAYVLDNALQRGQGALAHRQAMPDQWLLCSTHAWATFHRTSMSNLMTFLRWYEKSPQTWMHQNRNGNISAASRSGRDRPSLASREL